MYIMEWPVIPKKVAINGMAVVIYHMLQLPNNKELMLEMLTKRLTTPWWHIGNILWPKGLKNTTRTYQQEPLEFEMFQDNRKVCVIDFHKSYFNQTEGIHDSMREEGEKISLILSYKEPHEPMNSATHSSQICQDLSKFGRYWHYSSHRSLNQSRNMVKGKQSLVIL